MGERISRKTVTKQRISWVNELLKQFGKMTLRQIYYQLVTRGLNYRQVAYICKFGREQGLISWSGIVDRSRPVYDSGRTFESVNEFLDSIADYFNLNFWNGSESHIEIWTEKDALSQVIKEMALPYQVTVRVTKGFLSLSNKARWGSDDLTILYFGDFDPSGLLVDEDLQSSNLEWYHFERKALTKQQINQYNLPSIKVNRNDPRAKKYMETYGNECWELDALPPDVLQKLVKETIEEHVDFVLEQKQLEEAMLRNRIRELTGEFERGKA